MAESAERRKDIDLERAEAARKRAEERMAKKDKDDKIDAIRAEAALRRALVRIKLASS